MLAVHLLAFYFDFSGICMVTTKSFSTFSHEHGRRSGRLFSVARYHGIIVISRRRSRRQGCTFATPGIGEEGDPYHLEASWEGHLGTSEGAILSAFASLGLVMG